MIMTRYIVRVNRRVKNVRIYKVVKKLSGNTNLLTKVFLRIFAPRKKEEI